MNVMLTGATGLVGAHTAGALLKAGHCVRLLLRRPQVFERHMDALGAVPDWRSRTALITGDMCDAASVAQALDGAQGVVHAAAAVQMNAGSGIDIGQVNLGGAQQVLGQAAQRGLEHIVHVSSLSVLQTPGLRKIDESSPLVDATTDYGQSKCACELFARGLQAQGAGVRIVYPAAIVGPDDPGLSSANRGMLKFFQGWVPLTSSGFQLVDVRDLAAGIVRILQAEPMSDATQQRFVTGGHFLTWPRLRALCHQAGGQWKPPMLTPGVALRVMGQVADWLQTVRAFDTDLSADGMQYATRWVPGDSTRYLQTFDAEFRDPLQTIADTFAWLSRRAA